jgi:tetratricopeptide (TPR) repeat protein
MKSKIFIIIPCILILFSGFIAPQQQKPSSPPDDNPLPGKAPVLIRDEVDKPKTPVVRDPAKAEEEVKIGDFYFKRENYRAALARYQEALLDRPEYSLAQKKLMQAYEKLIQSLEKSKDLDGAKKYMLEYLEKFPAEKKSSEYQKVLAQNHQK